MYEKNKQYQKSDKRKGKRKEKSDKMYELYSQHQEEIKYSKGMLLRKNKVAESPNKAAKSDHDYIKNSEEVGLTYNIQYGSCLFEQNPSEKQLFLSKFT